MTKTTIAAAIVSSGIVGAGGAAGGAAGGVTGGAVGAALHASVVVLHPYAHVSVVCHAVPPTLHV